MLVSRTATMTGTRVVTLLLIGCWLGAAFATKSWEVPRRELWDHLDHDLDADWLTYLKKYNKSYGNREELTRRFYWEDTLRYIRDHNLRYDKGEVEYFLGENELADMADDEVEKIYMRDLVMPEGKDEYPEELNNPDKELPQHVDWRMAGFVSPVKNQGRCAASWAFSAVGALEGQHKKKFGRLIELSAQNLIDCIGSKYGSFGCRGGWMNNVFRYIQDNGGIDSEKCYPYVARFENCKYIKSCDTAQDEGFKNVGRSRGALEEALANIGPISIAMDTNHRSFWFYRGGIYRETSCNRWQPNRAMLAVGYGSRGGRDYWIVKNSWGTAWGNKGYLYLKRDDVDKCGITLYGSYPIV